MSNLKTAVIGYGYWGKNIARVFSHSIDFQLSCICDSQAKALASAKRLYPNTEMITNVEDIPSDIDVVAIITPVQSHFPLAKKFLMLGKHVLVTKPFTYTYEQAEELVRLAKQNKRCVFVDNTFVFHPAVRKMKSMLEKIGKPYFIVSQRMNLGNYQPDVNVAYDLMPHDVSIISYLLETEISASTNVLRNAAGLPQQDFAHSSFQTKCGVFGTITASWLSPFKIRQFIIVGSDGMLSYDDSEVIEKVKFFDRGVSIKEMSDASVAGNYTAQISYRTGDLFSPAIPNSEALAFELEEFKKAIEDVSADEYYQGLNLKIMRGLMHVVNPSAV